MGHNRNKIFQIILLSALLCCDRAGAQGLRFNGMESRIDDRTSFDAFNGHSRSFNGRLTIAFSIYKYPYSNFGYILRIKDKSSKIWNLSYDSSKGDITFRLNEEGRYSLIKAQFAREEMKDLRWSDIVLDFDSSSDSVSLSIAGRRYSSYDNTLPDRFTPSIQFGRSEYIIDVPSYAIRNLVISDNKRSFRFPLDEIEGNKVHDEKGRSLGAVKNPEWLIRESLEWTKKCELSLPNSAGVCYDKTQNRIWYFDNQTAYSYNLEDESTDKYIYANACPISIKTGSCYCNGDRIIAYEAYDDLQPEGSAMTAALTISDLSWEELSSSHLDFPMYHHSSFHKGDSLILFGGFGNQLYNGSFHSLDKAGNWHNIWEGKHPTLFPRYFAASGTDSDNNCVYIFGGMGNECGEQIVGRKYFYDLHRTDLTTGECTKLWELEWDSEDVVPVSSLIVDGEYFYTLCYPEYKSNSTLSLYRFSIKDGKYLRHSATIPIVSDKMNTTADLYFSREQGKLYAVTKESDDDIRSTLSIYSLSFPPVMDGECTNYGSKGRTLAILIIILALAAASLIFVVILSARKRKKAYESFAISILHPDKKRYPTVKCNNAILLFGELTLISRDGKDITYLLSAQQRLIFLLLVKYGRGKGLQSKRLSSYIWPGKEDEKVKNSRGVAINTLRKNLSDIDDLSIDFVDGCYKLNLGPRCYCDYYALLDDIAAPDRNINNLLCILSRGRFLKFTDDEAFDPMKNELDDILSPILRKELERCFKSKEHLNVIEISDMMFTIDPLDEDALKLQVKSLLKIQRKEEAMFRYSEFTAEYRKLNGEEYPVSFENL